MSVPFAQHMRVPFAQHKPVSFAQEGKMCRLNKDEDQVLRARAIVRTPRRLSTNPALAYNDKGEGLFVEFNIFSFRAD